MTTARRPRGPTDPDRASRIAAATTQVLRQSGIGGLTHRAVARQAEVPLGSTTYHFSTRQELLAAALLESIVENERLIAEWAIGLDSTNVAARLAALLEEQTTTDVARNRILVEHELYLAAARDANLRALSRRWDAVLRDVLKARVGVGPARVYHAAYMGLLMESVVSEEPLDRAGLENLLSTILVTETTPGLCGSSHGPAAARPLSPRREAAAPISAELS